MTHSDQLQSLLRHVRRRWAGVANATAAARAMAVAAAVGLAGVAAERLLGPSDVPLMALAAVTFAGACALAAWTLRSLRTRPTDRQVARFIEERSEGLEDRLVSATDLLDHGPGGLFGDLMLADATARARALRPDAIVPPDALRRAGWRLAAAVAGLALAVAVALPPASRAVRAARLRFLPDRFALTPEFSVTPLRPPQVAEIDVEYEYPAFTGLPPRRESDGGDIYAPAGTRVRLRVKADKPLRSGALTMGDGRRIDLSLRGEAELEGAIRIEADGSYRVALADTDGLSSAGDTEYFIRVMDDRPPDVRILRPAGDRKVTALEEVTIEARADDDYGIERLDLVYSVRGRQEQSVPLRGGGSPASRTGSHLLFVEDLGVQPGDFIAYYARARDVGRGKRSREARSDIYFLEVKPFEEEFEAARSAAMGAGRSGRSLEDLVRAQKDIISATWKLDRRKEGGRSADDIKAVARAQGDLKAQAAAAAGPMRATARGGRGEPGGEGGAGPLARAIDAMGRAQTELDAVRTAEALPHEMDALNQLLRAEAEIRRRQVSRQQQANAGGGSGRTDRDLSSLFDRELQRQQATNYETRPQTDEQGKGEKDPLEEIRELARRQNELSRRQRDLARATLDPEELKRQLERLTREQNDLRQRAEALERQLARERSAERPPAPSTGSGQGDRTQQQAQQGGQASGDQRMREIAREMRGAAGDLRRQDLETARERGERAAAELRELERELGEARPDERERALGRLQLEAREVADAQAQIAKEARQLGAQQKGGQADEATRRLAGEKARLADRVERLERSTARLAAAGEPGPVAEAARDLDRERLSSRMRESASSLRQPSGAQGREPADRAAGDPAEEARQARALDRVAKKLGEAGGARADAETRSLADQLARARELGDRLGELERKADRIGRDTKPPAEASPEPGGGSAGEIARLQREYARELRQAQAMLDRLRRDSSDLSGGLTPEAHEYSMGAPGTQAFKQDYTRWESLRRDVALALERYEQALSDELARKIIADRMNAGASVEMPEGYRALVARYFEALARKKK